MSLLIHHIKYNGNLKFQRLWRPSMKEWNILKTLWWLDHPFHRFRDVKKFQLKFLCSKTNVNILKTSFHRNRHTFGHLNEQQWIELSTPYARDITEVSFSNVAQKENLMNYVIKFLIHWEFIMTQSTKAAQLLKHFRINRIRINWQSDWFK